MSNIDTPHRKPWNLPGQSKPWHDTSGKPFANATRTHSAFYQTVQWRNLRNYYLRSHPLCEQCDKKGNTVPGYFVDHITPIQQGGEPLNEDNLQTLCKKCHAAKTNREIAQRK